MYCTVRDIINRPSAKGFLNQLITAVLAVYLPIVFCCLLLAPCHALSEKRLNSPGKIHASVPNNIPKYRNGAIDWEINWKSLEAHIYTETECVDLHIEDLCTHTGEDIGILWSYRLPVQIIENVPNAGETRYQDPATTFLMYKDYKKYYTVLSRVLGVKPIRINKKGQRRGALFPTNNNYLSFSEAHIFSTDDETVPLIVDFLPSWCTSWDEYEPFATDEYPNQLMWRIAAFTSGASLSGYNTSPYQCLEDNPRTPESRFPIHPKHRNGNTKVCLSSWGGTLYPLDGYNYAHKPVVSRALNSRKAIELADYLGEDVHKFDDKEDVLQLHYPKRSSCIRVGENPKHWAEGLEDPKAENHHVFIHWKRFYCCT